MARTVRFVAFYDEEYFGDRPMGSRLYAAAARKANDRITGMISLETMGYYTNALHSQHYPFPFSLYYPGTADFIAFVGNNRSRDFLHQAIGAFRACAQFPSEGIAAPWFARDAGRSDHGSFWREGFPAIMITDTAEFRYQYYHEPEDTPDKLDYDRTARVALGLVRVIKELANSPTHSN
jgi:Zn-dependent M28 family amino/carboxypeptidase